MKKVHQLSAMTLAITSMLSASVAADQTSRTNGMRNNTPSLTAIQNATIITEPGKSFTNATLVIEDGLIQSIERNNRAPAGARVIDGTGYTIYPGFIDPYSSYGIKVSNEQTPSHMPIYNNEREGGNAANDAIHSQKRWFSEFKTNSDDANKWISQGFTSVQSANLDGVFQGQAVTVSLADKIANDVIYQSEAKQFGSFDKGSSQQQYPSSLMGSIALVRQTLSDADWYETAYGKQAYDQPVEFNAALDSLTDIEKTGIVFNVNNEKSLLRADDVFDQFNVPAVYVASGYEYARLNAVKEAASTLIVPLDFPAAPDVAGVDGHLDVDLADLRHWERAPSNPGVLAQAGVDFALTLHDLEKAESFWPNLRKAVKHGLSEEKALASLTTIPAQIAGVEDKAGKLAQGYMADFIMVKGDLFADGTIQSVWLQGEEKQLVSRDKVDFVGNYRIDWNGQEVVVDIKPGAQLTGEVKVGEKTSALRHVESDTESLSFVTDLELEPAGSWRFKLEPEAKGTFAVTAVSPEGNELMLQAQTKTTEKPTDEAQEKAEVEYVSDLTFPNVAFGLNGLPERQDVVIRNVTVWTASDEGILEDTDVLVRDGEFAEIGDNLSVSSGVIEIDGAGMHLTPGIIDEHSHIAIEGGVNEGSEAITSEVRIGDVVNPDDIHIYRSLAGGTTMAQLLHGSANPIGGQAQVIKLRWGAEANIMKFDAAPESIKFALGENVKQSNWGDNMTVRYPQTRLGVETIMRDGFQAALEYQQRKQAYERMSRAERSKVAAPRPDYRLETLLEVLNSERFVHAHSYVASEILMLMEVAEDFGFTLDTFTHILEGYKVADEMAAHGASGSTFADWWAYKFEVYDAIPHNACLMKERGVLTSINSDSNDLQRRLNTEAAKSVLYCDMDPHEALKMITINPAKQLKVDEYVGSVEEGKHADFALWSHYPLSAYARVEQTWINGRKFFDRDLDKQHQQAVKEEKNALIQKVLAAGEEAKQGATDGYKPEQPTWHCDTEHDFWLDHFTGKGHQHGGQH
ncbi:amidohydrolase family protein [Idiomarina sp. HP20-50]|uniref:amidohydrolase family protein n=1 Tax=Idiomarina sp. HP20-50 TaxID=3070813 RepID=UPI00294B0818|nr:amidohydrolase family protein [Idiomarina sp. HP20-50]MDV6317096.1 amidohydrolase family protein [Idiomarina sp. HP20-50]